MANDRNSWRMNQTRGRARHCSCWYCDVELRRRKWREAKDALDAEAKATLDELTAEAERLGLYDSDK